MIRIKEFIVVEGKNDTLNLKRYFNCDTIETHGTCLSTFTINYIKKAVLTRGVIILTDPDGPGEKIRSIIQQRVQGCKHAFLKPEECRSEEKVGVESAGFEALQEALSHIATSSYEEPSISLEEYNSLHLDQQALRNRISMHFHLGHCNNKTLFKRLNMFQISKKDIERFLQHDKSDSDHLENK